MFNQIIHYISLIFKVKKQTTHLANSIVIAKKAKVFKSSIRPKGGLEIFLIRKAFDKGLILLK